MPQGLEVMTTLIDRAYGMGTSTGKSNVMVSSCKDVKVKIKMNGGNRGSQLYLGAIILAEGSSYEEIRARIGLVKAGMTMLNQHFHSN